MSTPKPRRKLSWLVSKNWLIALLLLIIFVLLVFINDLKKFIDSKYLSNVTMLLSDHKTDTGRSAEGMGPNSTKPASSKSPRDTKLVYRDNTKIIYRESDLYSQAKNKKSMQKYLVNFPNGKHSAEIRLLLQSIRESEAQRMILLTQKLQKYAPGLELVEIPSGAFQMGGATLEGYNEVNVAGFLLGKFEVTFAQYDFFAVETARVLPRDQGWGRASHPVMDVSWFDSMAYVEWLSQKTGEKFRLLSEAEWEYAARAGTFTQYYWGNNINCSDADYNYNECGAWGTSPVGSFKPNAFGLHDMLGNVWGWVEDCANSNYKPVRDDGSALTSGGNCNERVVRGGSWNNVPERLSVYERTTNHQNFRYSNLGFRLAL